MEPILPGATIGCLGGGQLGRMMGYAARSMGYDVHVLDPDPAPSAAAIASRTITAGFDDVAAAQELARGCDVVTLEIEGIHADVLDAVAAITRLHPGRAPVHIIQDRLRQKRWLHAQGFPVGPFDSADSAEALADVVTRFGASIAKSTSGGYDGRGQARLATAAEAPAAWKSLGGRECIVEGRIDIDFEIAALVARRADGLTAAYEPSRNHHTNGILTWAVVPAIVQLEMRERATELAVDIATRIGIVGLLAVELFVTRDGALLVNELAPRPHNTYHHSERAFGTSQFEMLVRAVCGLPLGSTDLDVPGAIVNLLGDVWLQQSSPDLPAALSVPSTRLHLYGKAGARAGRKMGHLSATGATPGEAVSRVLAAYRAMSPTTSGAFDVHDPGL